MRALRFREEAEYCKLWLELQALCLGLKDWREVMSPQEKAAALSAQGIDETSSPEFLEAKGEAGHVGHHPPLHP